MPASGSGANKILLVGEAAGEYEAKLGKPFVGAAGHQLDRMLKRAGMERPLFRIHNVLSCRPPNNFLSGAPYEAAAITHCSPLLDSTIAATKPKAIVALGNVPLQRLTGHDGILRYRGRVLESPYGWVIPTLHPSFLLPRHDSEVRNPARFTGAVIWDLKKAVEVAEHGFRREEPTYLCDPSPERFSAFALEFENALEREGVWLSWDIETPYKLKTKDEGEFDESERDTTILRISFSYRPGTGVSVPWLGPYLPTIKRLLRSRGAHVVWNGDAFDVPLVRANSVEVAGEVHDFMWGWHVYQSDLPMGLEFASSFFTDLCPWKHLNNVDPARYSAIDADATLRIALGVRAGLERTGQWAVFRRHVVALDPVLYEAGERGNLVNLEEQQRLRELLGEEVRRLEALVQEHVPEELKPRKRYKKLPKQYGTGHLGRFTWAEDERTFEPIIAIGKVKRCTICKAEHVKKGDHFKGGKKNPCKVAGGDIETIQSEVIEWDEVLPFNANSHEQIKNYIRHFDHPMGRDKKDKEKAASDKKHLEKLAKRFGEKHPIYRLTVDLHKASKALSTYVDGYRADRNGLIHTTYTHAPSTWRLSSRNVNLQNVGKRAENQWAKAARRTIIARPGNRLVQADSSAIEAVMVGYFMGDADYIDLARKGVHDYLACYSFGHKIAAREFGKAFIASVKAKVGAATYGEQREKAKRVVHGTNYGMGPKLMCEEYPDTFPTKLEAERWQRLLFEACPGLKKWQHEVRVRAHKETYLQNPWTHRHYFYDVFKQDFDGNIIAGGDANRAAAYLPQSSAACFMLDNLLALSETWLRDYMPANVSVHDGYCVDVPEAKVEEAAATLVGILTRPIPEMDGLRVGCEVEVGSNWGAFDEQKNPQGMKSLRKIEIES